MKSLKANIKPFYGFVLAFFISQLIDYYFFKSGNFLYLNSKLFFGLIGNNLIAVFISLIFLIIAYQILAPKHLLEYAVITGVTLSNIFDRIFYKGVVDYIQLPFWPNFNVADVLIILSLFFILFKIIKKIPLERDFSNKQ